MQKEVDVDFLYKKWLYGLGDERYTKNPRKGNIAGLFELLIKYGIEYDDAAAMKRRVMKDLINDEGRKNTNNKSSKHYKWLEKIEEDFDEVILEFYDPNEGLKIEKKVVYSRSKFMIKEDPEIVEWVKNRYGDNPDLIEQAHNVNNTLCLEYFNELQRKALNG